MSDRFDPVERLLADADGVRGKAEPPAKGTGAGEGLSSYLLHMPKAMHREVKARAAGEGMSMKDYLLKVIGEALVR